MGNTEGSLTQEQEETLVGCLLGDGTMRCKTNALLEINHSFKQKGLVDYLYLLFKEYTLTPPKIRKGRGNQQFSLEDLDLLRKKLFEQVKIETSLHKDKKYFRIWIRPKSVPRFVSLIKPYLIKGFDYKTPEFLR